LSSRRFTSKQQVASFPEIVQEVTQVLHLICTVVLADSVVMSRSFLPCTICHMWSRTTVHVLIITWYYRACNDLLSLREHQHVSMFCLRYLTNNIRPSAVTRSFSYPIGMLLPFQLGLIYSLLFDVVWRYLVVLPSFSSTILACSRIFNRIKQMGSVSKRRIDYRYRRPTSDSVSQQM
jgi:hypothetical protein